MTKIFTFDVFDTTLTRLVGSPPAVFLLLGKRLSIVPLISISPEAFARARADAEKQSYRNNGDAKTTLKSIYAELRATLRLTEEEAERIMKAECELEAELLRAVPSVETRIKEARAVDAKVIFLSDMYLPCEFIRQQLDARAISTPQDGCYVSSDVGELKATGRMYLELLRRENAVAENVWHCGNDFEGDIHAAQRSGINPEPFLEGNLNRYERTLEEYVWHTEGLSSAMAGASRLARLNTNAETNDQRALRDVAAGVMAPALTGYVLWVLQRAHQLRLKRLYFLSRDGQVMLEIARRLAPKLRVCTELRYLYSSRQALNVCGMIEDNEDVWFWLSDNPPFVSVETLLARVAIRPEEVRQHLTSAGFGEKDWSRNLTNVERRALTQAFEHGPIRSVIVVRAREKQKLATRFLKQEGLLDPSPWAIVDLGWHGSLQNALAVLLRAAGASLPYGFYFGLKRRPRDDRFGLRESYFFDTTRNEGFVREGTRRPFWLLEMFCAGDHGSVTDYGENGARIEPRLNHEGNDPVVSWGLPIVRATVGAFTENLLLDGSLVNPGADVRPAIAKLLNDFWSNPSQDEAKAWGRFPYDDGIGKESCISPVADAYSWPDVFKTFRAGRIEPHHRTSWHEACMELTPPHVRFMLKAACSAAVRMRG